MNPEKNKQSQKDLVVFLGQSTFPSGFGAVQRMKLMGKALIHDGYKVKVICRKGGSRKNMKLEFGPEGSFEGIDYKYTSGAIYRPDGFLERNLQKIKGALAEYSYLARLKKSDNLKVAIISIHSTFHILRYRLYSNLLGFPIVLNLVEMASSLDNAKTLTKKINYYLLDRFIIRTVDGALPISEMLMEFYKNASSSKPAIKLPILCDFAKFDPKITQRSEVIFTYCGAASYLELVTFILSAFDRLENIEDHVFLQLILGGTEGELKKVKQEISKAKNKDHVRLATNAPHEKIPEYYSKATALLIPLRPTVQDEARFPHKIGEYLASGRPMLTCRYGEIKYYGFEDEVNALITDEYEETAYAEKMAYVLHHPSKAEEIGMKGRQLGLDNFDYSKYGSILRTYFSKL